MMSERILVTGMGIISGLGYGKQATLDALCSKHSGIGKMKYLQTIHNYYPVSEVPMSDAEMMDSLGISSQTIITRTPLLGIMALKEAFIEAYLDKERPRRIAFINGTTVGGMEKSEQYYPDFQNTEAYIAAHDCGTSCEAIAEYFDGFDMITTISTACSSAANAIILGANLLKTGRVDVAIVGGTECLSKFHLNGFSTLMILDKEACKPFDAKRVGLNLGEGAAYLVLEKEQHAKQRGVQPICMLSGYANTCDAYHQTASSPDGQGAYLAMHNALEDAHLHPHDIDYINAHGTGTQNNDLSEGTAIMRVFNDNIPPVSSTKSFTGHTTSAAGSVESIISILALLHNFIPANLNFNNPMPELSFCPVKDTLTKKMQHVLTNSFGFGGNDSACIFSKID